MSENILKHVAIIMDGNGRWAELRKHQRIFGHVQGAKKAREMIYFFSKNKLPFLSLFAFSTENALRPKKEVESLDQLLQKNLFKHQDFLEDLDIRFCVLGDISFFSESIRKSLHALVERSKNNQGMCLILALNYSGRQEILQGAKDLIKKARESSNSLENLDEKSLASFFSSSAFPEPDIIIRTGGQTRLSNFYLWSAAYSELHFTETLWPDFDSKELETILKTFLSRPRKFGKLLERS